MKPKWSRVGTELSLQISFGEEIKTEYTWLQEHTRTRKRGRVQRYKFNAKQGRQVRPRLLLFSAAQSTDGDNEMGTHYSFANGSAKAFGAFAVKLRDNGDVHHVQALFVDKDDHVVPANYPARHQPFLICMGARLMFENTIDGPATEVSSSFEGARLPTRDPQASTPFEGAHASPAIQEHATEADLTKVLEKVTKNTVRDVIKEIKPLFKLGNVKKTKNAKQDDGVINKISDKLDQQAKSLDAAAAAINKLTDKLNNTHEKSDLESGSASENSSEDENDFEKRNCNFCAVPSSYYFGPVALPPISSVPTPISSVPTHQELMHQQMQVSPASVLGQAQVCPSCRSTFQHPTVPQFSYSFPVPLPSYSGGTIYQTPPHPVTHSHAEKKKKKAHSSKRCIAFKRQKQIHEVD
eukprot:g52102.t1